MISLYILGYKGLLVIKELSNDYLRNINCVIIGRDKNVQNDFYEESKRVCMERDLPFVERGNETVNQSKYLIMIGWRWLVIPKKNEKLLIFHDSILPKYRGFNPLTTALINGDKKIGATIIEGMEEYDTGNIISQKIVKIKYPIKIDDAIKIMGKIYSELFNDLMVKIISGKDLKSKKQDAKAVTYSLWRNAEDYFIDWNWSSKKIVRFINAVGYPYDYAKSKVGNKIVVIKNAESTAKDIRITNRDVGKIIFKDDASITIVCGEGLLIVKQLFNQNGTQFSLKNKFRIKFGNGI
ncbi:hypothetical protein BH11BAC3_BH11BAC3_19480 [soil metagenome]